MRIYISLIVPLFLFACESLSLSETTRDWQGIWLTSADGTKKLSHLSHPPEFADSAKQYPVIDLDDSRRYQSVAGFGYTLTGGSARLIMGLSEHQRKELLQELFGREENSISISYLRLSIGASDLNDAVFTYNDLPEGDTDTSLKRFDLGPDRKFLLPLLKEILAVRPDIKFIATPWTAPSWMKDNGNSVGGSLIKAYYGVYANYFLRYIDVMKEEGITIDAITPQNEPLHPGNNPSMYMSAEDQKEFIRDHLGPAFERAGIMTKIFIYDHNCDRPDYPISILSDSIAAGFVAGSAFHLYSGDISALSAVHNKFPDKEIYFTEQYTGADGSFAGDLHWHIRHVVIGSLRNWSRTVFEWNLAADTHFGPHTPGGCTTCKGALTIDGDSVLSRNVSYYILGHISKFLPPGSVRIESNSQSPLLHIAFKRPDGTNFLLVLNDGSERQGFSLEKNGKFFSMTLNAGDLASLIW